MPDESKQIGVIGLTQDGTATVREPIFVSLSKFKNTKYLDIRKYYQKEGEWKPTTKGITLSGSQIEELVSIIKENNTAVEEWFSEKEK